MYVPKPFQQNANQWNLVIVTLEQNKPIGELFEDRGFRKWATAICKRTLRKYEDPMKVCYGSSYDEEDLFDDFCCKLLTRKNPFAKEMPRNEAALTAYVSRVVKNVVLSKLRRLRKIGKQPTMVPWDDIEAPDTQTQKKLEEKLFWQEFEEFSTRVPAKWRHAVLLRSERRANQGDCKRVGLFSYGGSELHKRYDQGLSGISEGAKRSRRGGSRPIAPIGLFAGRRVR